MITSGILLIDKPVGITSFDVIRKLRKITSIRKMGHTGTLDPFASGLLIICLGKATRIATKIITGDKQYYARMRLGLKTDTGDLTGKVIQEKHVENISIDKIKALQPSILALQEQIPPRYSAIKVNGKKAYQLARKGIDFQLEPRPIKLSSFDFGEIAIPDITYETTVSKGTYLRVLSETIAARLDNIGVTVELRRTAIGGIEVKQACCLAELNAMNWTEKLFPLINLFTEYPQIRISEERKHDFQQGRRFKVEFADHNEVVVALNNEMLGFAEIEQGILQPRIVLI